jgi:hypothetical protein
VPRASLAATALYSLLLAAACTPAPESSTEADVGGADEASAGELAEAGEDSGEMPQMHFRQQVAYAVNDLAERLGVPPETVSVTTAQPVTWRSSALGCPQPDRAYMDALVPGVRILLSAGIGVYAYHAANGRQPFNCPLDRAELPVYDEDSSQL